MIIAIIINTDMTPSLIRRFVLTVACFMVVGIASLPAHAEPIVLEDVVGRTVTLPAPAKRVVLA